MLEFSLFWVVVLVRAGVAFLFEACGLATLESVVILPIFWIIEHVRWLPWTCFGFGLDYCVSTFLWTRAGLGAIRTFCSSHPCKASVVTIARVLSGVCEKCGNLLNASQGRDDPNFFRATTVNHWKVSDAVAGINREPELSNFIDGSPFAYRRLVQCAFECYLIWIQYKFEHDLGMDVCFSEHFIVLLTRSVVWLKGCNASLSTILSGLNTKLSTTLGSLSVLLNIFIVLLTNRL